MSADNLLKGHAETTKNKLSEAKLNVKLFALDYDGTIYDGRDFKESQVIALVEKIIDKNKFVAIVTARAATALKIIAPPIKEFLFEKDIKSPVFIAGGNGAILYKIGGGELAQIYNHGLSVEEIKYAVNCWDKVYKDLKINEEELSPRGIETFRNFIKEDWSGYVPNEIIELCKPYSGKLFTEEAKVTFVLPKDKTIHKQIIERVQAELGGNYSLKAGDETFAHITKRLEEDGKIVAVKSVLKDLNLEEDEVATFGDMPEGNDKGLLSFPYSFTNSEEFVQKKKSIREAPFVLINQNSDPIAKVYKTIDYILFD